MRKPMQAGRSYLANESETSDAFDGLLSTIIHFSTIFEALSLSMR